MRSGVFWALWRLASRREQQKATIVESGQYKCRHKLLDGSNKEEMSDRDDPDQLEKDGLSDSAWFLNDNVSEITPRFLTERVMVDTENVDRGRCVPKLDAPRLSRSLFIIFFPNYTEACTKKYERTRDQGRVIYTFFKSLFLSNLWCLPCTKVHFWSCWLTSKLSTPTANFFFFCWNWLFRLLCAPLEKSLSTDFLNFPCFNLS